MVVPCPQQTFFNIWLTKIGPTRKQKTEKTWEGAGTRGQNFSTGISQKTRENQTKEETGWVAKTDESEAAQC